MQSIKCFCFAVALIGWSVTCGCGRGDRPPLGTVSGTVTLDGTPLSGVIINFKPEQGRPATATTDEQGQYSLAYTYGVTGAKVGPSTVMFEWPLGESGPTIPAKYTGMNSELQVDVEEGTNELNFDLTTN